MICLQTVSKFCKEDISLIENYDKAMADTTQTWHCHHRTEIWWNCSKKDLIENECYYGRKAHELIFLTKSEHGKLHYSGNGNPMYGRTGENHSRYGKKHSAETRQKMAEGHRKYWANKRGA